MDYINFESIDEETFNFFSSLLCQEKTGTFIVPKLSSDIIIIILGKKLALCIIIYYEFATAVLGAPHKDWTYSGYRIRHMQ